MTSAVPRLPRLWAGVRRRWMTLLVGVALAHTAFALIAALAVGALLAATGTQIAVLIAVIGVALLGVGVTKIGERVTAEKLGQNYVHELRGRVVSASFDAGSSAGQPSLGITIARATNDLTAIRSWVAQGIAPLIAAATLLIGTLIVLAVLHPALAVAAAVPLIVLIAVIQPASRAVFTRARRVRRLRGRLAARVTDTLGAREGIVAAGGTDRELRRVGSASEEVVTAAVVRARAVGLLEGAAVVASASVAALLVVSGRMTDAAPAAIATSLTLAGLLAASLAGLGRIVELRQNDRAARRILAPLLDRPGHLAHRSTRQARRAETRPGFVVITGLPSGRVVAGRAGDRIRLTGADGPELSRLLWQFAVPATDAQLTVIIDGWDAGMLAPERRRELVGLAAHGAALERGSIARAVRYRRPDLSSDEAWRVLGRVGLASIVEGLDRGARTELRRGGAPLADREVALLRLARAVVGEPPLLLLDRVDVELDDAGLVALHRLVEDYPGVVIFTSDVPERVARDFRTVSVEDLARG